MALVNPNIALSAKPIEIADPMSMYGKIAAIQSAQNQNALAQFQLGAAQRAEETQNALSRAYQSAYNPETGKIDTNKLRQSLATGGFGAQIPTVEKALGEIETQALTRQKTEGELFDTSMKQIRNLWGNVRTPEDAMAVHMATHRDPIINKRLRALGITEEMGRQQILQAAQNPQAFGEFVQRAQLGAEKFMELNKPTFVEAGGVRVPVSGLTGQRLANVPTIEQQPLPANVEAQKSRIAQAGAARQNVFNVQEKAEAGEFGKMLVGEYSDISKAAKLAAKTLPSIEANLGALNKGLDTGFGTEAKAAGARILGALGVEGAEKLATDTQTFQSNAINAVLQKQLEQKGPQTESDARRIEQVGAELGKTKAANEFILTMAKEQLRRDIDQRNFYAKWKERTGSFNGAEDAWFAGEGGKSLFDRPALKKYAPGPSAVQQIPGQRPAPAAAPAAAPVVTPNIDALLRKYQ